MLDHFYNSNKLYEGVLIMGEENKKTEEKREIKNNIPTKKEVGDSWTAAPIDNCLFKFVEKCYEIRYKIWKPK